MLADEISRNISLVRLILAFCDLISWTHLTTRLAFRWLWWGSFINRRGALNSSRHSIGNAAIKLWPYVQSNNFIWLTETDLCVHSIQKLKFTQYFLKLPVISLDKNTQTCSLLWLMFNGELTWTVLWNRSMLFGYLFRINLPQNQKTYLSNPEGSVQHLGKTDLIEHLAFRKWVHGVNYL